MLQHYKLFMLVELVKFVQVFRLESKKEITLSVVKA